MEAAATAASVNLPKRIIQLLFMLIWCLTVDCGTTINLIQALNLCWMVKKKAALKPPFKTWNPQKSGAGWAIVVIASSDNDTADNSNSSQNSNDNAAASANFAFFLGASAYALNLGSANCLCSRREWFSHYWRAYKRSGCYSSERKLTETHFVLLFCEVRGTRERLLHNRGAISSIESQSKRKLSRFIEVLHISYNKRAGTATMG
jgi:hypothetical protein